MNTENSGYTILYAAIMVIIVALGLSFTHQVLNEKQTTNVHIDKMQQILRSLNIDASAADAQAQYNELIKNAYLIDSEGKKVEGTEGITPDDPAFSTEAGGENAAGLPVFEANVNGSVKYVLPMRGTGLWGPIWGYLAVDADGSTIFGAEFGHAGETPGLGAEIVQPSFRSQFAGKKLFKEGQFRSVAVVKPGKADANRDYVNGISGATITSKGVNAMLLQSIGAYEKFLMNLQAAR